MRHEDPHEAQGGAYGRGGYNAPASKESELRMAQQSLSLLKMKMQANGMIKGSSRQNFQNQYEDYGAKNPPPGNPRQPNPMPQRHYQAYSNPELEKKGMQNDQKSQFANPGEGKPGVRPAYSFQDNFRGNSRGQRGNAQNDSYGDIMGKKPSIDEKTGGQGYQAEDRNNVFGYAANNQKGRPGLSSTTTSDTQASRYNNRPEKNLGQTDVGYKANATTGMGDPVGDSRRAFQAKSAQPPANPRGDFQPPQRGYQNHQPESDYPSRNQPPNRGGNRPDNNPRRPNYDQDDYDGQNNYGNQPSRDNNRGKGYQDPDPYQRGPSNARNQPAYPPSTQNKPGKSAPPQRYSDYDSQGNDNPEDEQIIGKPNATSYDLNKAEIPEFAKVQTYPCREGCGRKFAMEALEKHEKICRKVFKEKRPTFDITEHRYDDDIKEAIVKVKKHGGRKEGQKEGRKDPNRIPKWKLESAQLKMASKLARGEDVANTEDAKLVQIMEKQDKIDCPTCGRNFAEAAGKRHIPFCAEKSKAQRMKQTGNNATLKQPLNPKAKK